MNPLFLKVIIWRCISILITCLISLIFIRDIGGATTFTLALHSFLVISHYMFEKFWNERYSDPAQVKK